MNQSDKQRFSEVLGGVHDFYGKELSKFAVAVWLQACESFDIEQITKAFSAHLMDPERGQFMPKPADLVRQLQGTRSDRCLIAWGKVLDAIQRVGAYTSVCFDDGLIHAVIEDMGGWVQLCRGEIDDLPFVQKRFCETYRAYSARGDVSYPSQLAGECDAANALKGYRIKPPTLVGDPAKAGQVMLAGGQPKTRITHVADALQGLRRIGSAA